MNHCSSHSGGELPLKQREAFSSANVATNSLLDRSDVSRLMGVSPTTASKIMKESGRSIRVHSRLYILRDSLFQYLRECERSGGECRE